MCRRDDFTSTTTHMVLSQNFSVSADVANLLHRVRRPWILEHPCDLWLWEMPDSCGTDSHGLGPGGLLYFGSQCRERTLNLIENVDSRDLHRIARKCSGTGGRCSVSGQKLVHPNSSTSRSDTHSSCDHARPPCLSFARTMTLAMNARRFQRTHPLSGICNQRVKRNWHGSF